MDEDYFFRKYLNQYVYKIILSNLDCKDFLSLRSTCKSLENLQYYSDKDKILKLASKYGHLKIFKFLSDGKQGKKYLTIASGYGNIEIVETILENSNINLSSALYLSSRYGRYEVAKQLLYYSKNNVMFTLKMSVKYGYYKIVEDLLSKIILPGTKKLSQHQNVQYKSLLEEGHTMILLALEKKSSSKKRPNVSHNKVVNLLLQTGCIEPVEEILNYSVKYNHAKATIYCLEKIQPHNSLLSEASKNGHSRIMKILLGYNPKNSKFTKINPAANKNSALRWAIQNGHIECVSLLITDDRINPAANMNKIVQFACYKGRNKILKLLLADPRTDPAAFDNIGIKWSCENGYYNVAKTLLQYVPVSGERKYVDPTAESNYAIRFAACGGYHKIVKLLLNYIPPVKGMKYVDPSDKNDLALKWAQRNDHQKIVDILISHPRR